MKNLEVNPFAFLLALCACFTLCACSSTGDDQGSSIAPATENEEAGMSQPAEIESSYEVRAGASGFTLGYDDLSDSYDVAGGYSREAMTRKPPLPEDGMTVLSAQPDPSRAQVLYLWEEGNVPAVTEFTSDMTGYYDSSDFRPYVTALPVPQGVAPKGAVVLMAGGAYQVRGDYTDTIPTALQLREQGFHCFVVDYRLRPYTPQEGALDVARAVRFVIKNADAYGIDPTAVAVMGYSAGGIQAGEFLMHYDGEVDGSTLDPEYLPDELDSVPAHVSADAMIYSFYGRLSVASLDVADLQDADLPPTFYCYGTEDPFYRQFEAQVALMDEVGVPTTTLVLQDWPHGFGGDGSWVADYAAWLEKVFEDATPSAAPPQYRVTPGTETYRGFTLDNVLHSEAEGDIHFNLFVPESFDGSGGAALFVTLPGYQGLYFQGVGENIRTEDFAFEAQAYDPGMIIVAPQLSDWGETSARQTIALVEYLIGAYAIDAERVFLEGYSGGGETLSLVMGMEPQLFCAALFCASRWDGDLSVLADAQVPVYLAIGENDEHYGSGPAREAAAELAGIYRSRGLSEDEVARLVTLDVKDAGYFQRGGVTSQHGGGAALFSRDPAVMGWLFGQE